MNDNIAMHWRISWHFQIVIRTKSTRRCNLRNTAKKFVCIQFLSIQRTTRYSSNVFLWAAVQLWGAGRWTSKVATFPTLDIWPRFAARHNKVQPCILTLCLLSSRTLQCIGDNASLFSPVRFQLWYGEKYRRASPWRKVFKWYWQRLLSSGSPQRNVKS